MDRGSILIGALLAGVLCNLGYLPKAIRYFQPKASSVAVPGPENLKAAANSSKLIDVQAPEVLPAETVSIPPESSELVEDSAPLPSAYKKAIQFEGEVDTEALRNIQKALAGLGKYVKGEVGVHGPSGMPQDHVQVDLISGKPIGYPANYSAASKLSVYLPFLLKASQNHPVLKKTHITRVEALELAKKAFLALRKFQKTGEGKEVYAGLFPWFEMRGDGSLVIAKYGGRRMVPVLDNGELTLALWAWAGDETIQNAEEGTLEQEIRILVNEIIDNQHYEKWLDYPTGLLYAEWNLDEGKGVPAPPDINLWTEWMMAQFVALVQNKIQVKHWLEYGNQTFSYRLKDRTIDMPQGYIFSMHEMWSLLYLKNFLMKSKLAPLFRNYMYLHAEHSANRNVPGMVATEYGQEGYTQAGIDLARLGRGHNGKIDSEIQATAYGSALASLIDPKRGLEWTLYHFKQPGVIGKYGPVTSFSREGGAAPMYTADASFMTAAALAGGVSDEILRFVSKKYRKAEKDLCAYFDMHADQILKRLGRSQFEAVDASEIPEPPYPGDFSVQSIESEKGFEGTLELVQKLQRGHWHGSNVYVPSAYAKWKSEKDQAWVMKEDEIVGGYQITTAKRYAWLGTPVTPVSIQGARYVSFWIPANLKNEAWQMELKNNSVEIARRIDIETIREGKISKDGLWKQLVFPLRVFPGRKNTLNYFAISVPDPFSKKSRYKQSGLIHIKDIRLHSEDPRRPDPAAAEV